MVQESFKQTRARYDLAELSRREEEIKDSLEKLRAREQGLRSPARLAAIVREKKMSLVSLGSALPAQAEARGRNAVQARRPGAVLDEEFVRMEREVRMASAGY